MYVIYWRELIFISRIVGSLGISSRKKKKIVLWTKVLPKFMAGFRKALAIKAWIKRWKQSHFYKLLDHKYSK